MRFASAEVGATVDALGAGGRFATIAHERGTPARAVTCRGMNRHGREAEQVISLRPGRHPDQVAGPPQTSEVVTVRGTLGTQTWYAPGLSRLRPRLMPTHARVSMRVFEEGCGFTA
eukprot:5118322-Pleurochrysis_carterae.AAC.1